MKPILYLQPLSHETASFLELPGARNLVVQRVYDLPYTDLGRYGALLVPAHIDQRAFAACAAQVAGFLDGGGIVVFNGHIAYPFLPELTPFVPVPGYSFDLLRVQRVAEHPVFAGVEVADLTFRRGVAGFYGRGHNPPPAGATVLHRLSGGNVPLDWLWQRPAGGTLLMHGGNNMWMYADDATSAARIAPQLLAWLSDSLVRSDLKELA